MFQYLRSRPRILVTGLMRSGTTICSEMVGYDTGHAVFREEAVVGGVNELPDGPVVVQAPSFLKAALEFKAKGWHVILLVRKWDECVESTKKFMMEFHPNIREESLMKVLEKQRDFLQMLLDSDMVPMVVRYEDLRLHPLWVEDRKGWKMRQTKDGPVSIREMGLL